VNAHSGLFLARNATVSTQNKPDRDIFKTQSWDTRHDETRKLETEPRQDIQVSRLSQDRDMKNNVSRQSRHKARVLRLHHWIIDPSYVVFEFLLKFARFLRRFFRFAKNSSNSVFTQRCKIVGSRILYLVRLCHLSSLMQCWIQTRKSHICVVTWISKRVFLTYCQFSTSFWFRPYQQCCGQMNVNFQNRRSRSNSYKCVIICTNKINTRGWRCLTKHKPQQAAERAEKCRFLFLATLTFDFDLQTHPSEGPNTSSVWIGATP